jgi:signal transduction histidine kinase
VGRHPCSDLHVALLDERGPLLPSHLEDALRDLEVEFPQRRQSILLVDDEPENLEVYVALLDGLADVHTATSGIEALRIIESGRDVDLVIADQRMHGMTGVQLLTRIAEQRPDIVRIVLTAYSDVEPMLVAINRAKAWRFLVKPYDPEELRAAVTEALRVKANVELLRQLAHLLTDHRDALNEALHELRQAQDELLSLERLATVGPAVAGIVHNLRNLSTLMAFVMAEIARHDVPSAVLETVRSAQGNMDSLIDLLENVHQLARPEDLDLKLEPTDLARFLGATAALGMMQAGGHPICTETPSETLSARIDVERMRQGLLALVDNAVRASRSREPIKLTARTIPPPSSSGATSPLWLCFEVSDQGCGMDDDTLQRAAEPFYSGFSPPRLGLGLELARLAARAHGGHVELESEKGQGTVARLLLPFDSNHEEQNHRV